MADNDKSAVEIVAPESSSRRKAVKTIVGGVTALAAYNMLPVKWETPIIEQVFLPAHAQTSGEIESELVTTEPESAPDVCATDFTIGVVNETSVPAVDIEVEYTSRDVGPITVSVSPGISTFTLACNDTTMTITSPVIKTFQANGVDQVTTSVTITVDSDKGVFIRDVN